MKKMIGTLLLVSLLVVSVGCNNKEKANETNKTTETTEVSETKKFRKTKEEIEASKKEREIEEAKKEKEEQQLEALMKLEEAKAAAKAAAKEKKRKESSAEPKPRADTSSNDDTITAEGLDFSEISRQDVIRQLGEPDEKIKDPELIMALLDELELEIAIAEGVSGNLDQEEVRTFAFGATDISLAIGIGMEVDCYFYNDRAKPNVYFSGDEVVFISATVATL